MFSSKNSPNVCGKRIDYFHVCYVFQNRNDFIPHLMQDGLGYQSLNAKYTYFIGREGQYPIKVGYKVREGGPGTR